VVGEFDVAAACAGVVGACHVAFEPVVYPSFEGLLVVHVCVRGGVDGWMLDIIFSLSRLGIDCLGE